MLNLFYFETSIVVIHFKVKKISKLRIFNSVFATVTSGIDQNTRGSNELKAPHQMCTELFRNSSTVLLRIYVEISD